MLVRLGKRGLRMFLGAAAIFVIGAGVAWAAIPGSSGVISGCYEKRTGILRVIDAETGKTCLSFETPISWNEAGLKGPMGDKGPTGDKGLAGDKGPQGDPGLAGERGPMGAQGLEGEKGPTGDSGEQGPAGDKGPLGDKGAVGDKGPQGDPGPPGGGIAGWEARLSATISDSATVKEIFARCPAGKRVIGGGFRLGDDVRNIVVVWSVPFSVPEGDGWHVIARERTESSSDWWVGANAACAS